MRRKCSSYLPRDERHRGPFYRSTRRLLILMILIFLLSSTINNYRSLEEATPLSPFAADVDSTNPPVVPEKQYWGTFYYPWYGDGELPDAW